MDFSQHALDRWNGIMETPNRIGEGPKHGDNCQRKISAQACNVLSQLRKNGQLCDAVLKAGEQEFQVHRNILSACSEYFRKVFTSKLYETDQKVVEVPGVSSRILELIIEYAYTREVDINADNVEELLPVADQLHIIGLIKACSQYLKANLDIDNCIGIRSFAKAYFCVDLEKGAMRFILRNFQDICENSSELLSLQLEELVEILSHDELNAKTEEPVFETVIRWIDHDAPDRRKHIFTLLKCVRLCLLSTTYFVEKVYFNMIPVTPSRSPTVKSHPYVSSNEQCKPLVIDTLKFLYDLDLSDDREVDTSNPLGRPRIPHDILFAIGGWSGGSPTNVMESYDTRADRWIQCPWGDPLGPRAYHGTATVDGLIYICGGFDGVRYFNSVRCFHPVDKVWADVSPMHSQRCYISVTVLDRKIYALGGYDGQHRQNTAERYDPSTNQWSFIAPMHEQRSDASATTLDGKVYIVGGFNGSECLNSAEYYNPETNQWSMIGHLRNRRSGISIIAHQGQIFAIGGFNGTSRMSSGEKYDPTKNTWSPIAEMYSPRSNYAIEFRNPLNAPKNSIEQALRLFTRSKWKPLAKNCIDDLFFKVIDDMIFAIGGFNGVTTIYNVECYDNTLDEWYDATDMNVFRSALSACVVKGLPNIMDYIHHNRGSGKHNRNHTTNGN